MKLSRALLCAEIDCGEVFEAGGASTCPACGCSVAFPLERAVNRTTTAHATAIPSFPEPKPAKVLRMRGGRGR